MRRISEIHDRLKGMPVHTVAVAAAADTEVLHAVAAARRTGMAEAALFGKAEDIKACLNKIGEDAEAYTIHDCGNDRMAAEKAVQSVSGGRYDFLMKGLLPSGDFIRAVLNREWGLRKSEDILSAVAVFELQIEGEERLLFLTDPGFVPLPDLKMKTQMLCNMTEKLHRLGYDMPRIAVLSAMETVNPKIPSSIEAKTLEEMNQRGEIAGCLIGGPFSLDLALSKSSAKHKGFLHPVAGKADAILVPSLETGNAVQKTISCLVKCPSAGFVCGTVKPVVFTSRSDSAETKLNSIAMAALLAG